MEDQDPKCAQNQQSAEDAYRSRSRDLITDVIKADVRTEVLAYLADALFGWHNSSDTDKSVDGLLSYLTHFSSAGQPLKVEPPEPEPEKEEVERFDPVERKYRARLRNDIAYSVRGWYVSTGSLAFIAEVLNGWQSSGHDCEDLVNEVKEYYEVARGYDVKRLAIR